MSVQTKRSERKDGQDTNTQAIKKVSNDQKKVRKNGDKKNGNVTKVCRCPYSTTYLHMSTSDRVRLREVSVEKRTMVGGGLIVYGKMSKS